MSSERRSPTAELVRRETVIASPFLCPEVRLHLITDACPMWRATEADLDALEIGAPYWAFAWAGGQAIARHVLDHPDVVRGARVLDFGSGSALVGIAAARAGALHVLAADVDPVAAVAAELNAGLNDVRIDTTMEDLVGVAVDVDVILAGDVTYERSLAAAVLTWLEARAAEGVTVLVGDPGRGFFGVDRLRTVATYDAPTDTSMGADTRPTSVQTPSVQSQSS